MLRSGLIGAAIVLLALPAFAAPRTILVEGFLNDGSESCRALQPELGTWADARSREGSVVPLAYHVGWPNSADTFYRPNAAELDELAGLRHVQYTPTFRIEGRSTLDPHAFDLYADYYRAIDREIDRLRQDPSSVSLTARADVIGVGLRLAVDIDVESSDGIGDRQVLRAAVALRSPLETGGWLHFVDFSDGGADGVPLNLAEIVSQRFEWIAPLPERARDRLAGEELVVVAWIRDDGGGVLNATRAEAVGGEAVSVEPAPVSLSLRTAPNPVQGASRIEFALPETGLVQLAVYDVRGREVARLIDGSTPAGRHHVAWSGGGSNTDRLPGGVYFVRLKTAHGERSEKVVLVR